MHRLPSPFFIVLSVLIFASSLCNALYGPSSPVVQLSPSNFKSKVTWLPLCSASSCLVGEKVVGEWKRTVNLELSYKEQENDSDDYLRKLIIFSSDHKLLKVLKYAALNWLQSAIFLFFFSYIVDLAWCSFLCSLSSSSSCLRKYMRSHPLHFPSHPIEKCQTLKNAAAPTYQLHIGFSFEIVNFWNWGM